MSQRWPSIQAVAQALVVALPVLLLLGPAPADIAMSLTAILFLARSAIDRDWGWLRSWWVRIALLAWVFMTATAPFAHHPDVALPATLVWVRFIVFGAALEHWVLREQRTRRWLAFSAGGVIVLAAGWALVEYVQNVLAGKSYARLTGPFHDPKVGIFIAKMMFPVLGALFGWLALIWSGRRLAAVFGLIVLLIAAIFLSGERMALLLTGLGFVIFVLFLGSRPIRRVALWSGLAIVAIVAVAGLVAPSVYHRQVNTTVEAVTNLLHTAYGRLWVSGVDLGLGDPVIGIGRKNFRHVCMEAFGDEPGIEDHNDYNARHLCSTHPHNVYVEWFAETGVIGLALFLAMIAAWGREVFRHRLDDVASGAVIAVIVQIWPIAAQGSMFTNWNGVIFWLVIGWMLAELASRPLRRNDAGGREKGQTERA